MAAPATPTSAPIEKPPHPPRWIPLSFKFFGGFLVILGTVGLPWIGVRHYRNSTALNAIQSAGGRAELRAGGPAWLRLWIGDKGMLGFDEIVAVNLMSTATTDESLTPILKLKALQRLELRETRVTDAGLSNLEELTSLSQLNVDDTQVTDAGLIHLQKLQGLTQVSLCNDQITTAGLIHLKELTGLKRLQLFGTQITDSGLVHLQALP